MFAGTCGSLDLAVDAPDRMARLELSDKAVDMFCRGVMGRGKASGEGHGMLEEPMDVGRVDED